MNSKTVLISALALAIGASGASGAFAATTNSAAKDPAKREKHIARMIKRLDTDGDKKVSKPEMEAAMTKAFSIVDKNQDGKISKAELEGQRDALKAYRQKVKADKQVGAARVTAFPKSLVKNFDKIDANKDGVLSMSEMNGVVDKIFQHRDKNKDGYLTAEDFQKKA